MASNSGGFSITLTSTQLYWLYLFLVIGDVALAYVAKILPSDYGTAGLGVIAISFFGTLSHDYTEAHSPNGVPTWLSYVVITIAGALVGAIGFFTSDTVLTTTAFVAWLIVVLTAIANDVTEDAGESLPAYAETVIAAFIGLAVTFLTWLGQNPTASTGAIIATIIAILTSYFHVSITAGAAAKAKAA